ncbi:TetR/AcrR family transcriptional regulator C-terminal domain-containing protein [Streptomyces sp. NPDC001450]
MDGFTLRTGTAPSRCVAPWVDTQEPALLALLATGRFPALSRLATTGYDLDLDALFEFGLQSLLGGLAPLLEASSAG